MGSDSNRYYGDKVLVARSTSGKAVYEQPPVNYMWKKKEGDHVSSLDKQLTSLKMGFLRCDCQDLSTCVRNDNIEFKFLYRIDKL